MRKYKKTRQASSSEEQAQNRALKPRLFIAYKQKPIRKELIENPSDRPENYLLWGFKEYKSKGFDVMHNLDHP